MKDILEQQAEFVFDINQTMLTFSSLPVTVSWTLLVLWLFMHNNLQKFSFIKTKFLLLMFIVFISIFYAYLIAIQYFSNQSYNSVFFLCLSAMIFAVPLFTSYLLMNSKVRSIFTVREK